MFPPRVLVVDGDREQRRVYSRFLSRHGYQALVAASALEAFALARAVQPQAALVEISLQGTDGIALLRRLQAESRTARMPVLLMTGLALPESLKKIVSEYLSVGEVFIKGNDRSALLRQVQRAIAGAAAPAPAVSFGRFLKRGRVVLDTQARKAWIDNREIPSLSPRSFDLLCAFVNSDKPLSRQALLARVWPEGDNVNLVDVTIHRLRKRFSSLPSVRIDTVGSGYQLVVK